MPEINSPTTLGEYALKKKIRKSLLNYYVEKGLLKPTGKIGNTFFFDEEYLDKQLSTVKSGKDDGKTLDEIRDSIYGIQNVDS